VSEQRQAHCFRVDERTWERAQRRAWHDRTTVSAVLRATIESYADGLPAELEQDDSLGLTIQVGSAV
jgi:hypothetical protein